MLDARAKGEFAMKCGYWRDGFVSRFSVVLMVVDGDGVIFDLTEIPKGSWGMMGRKWFQDAWDRLVSGGLAGGLGVRSPYFYEFEKEVYDRTSLVGVQVGDVFDREGYEEYHALLLKASA